MTGKTLHAAVTAGDRASVEQLLADGASALAAVEPSGSLLRLAHAGSESPEGRALFNTLRSAARAEAEGRERLPGLGSKEGAVDPGVGSLRARVGDRLEVLLLEGSSALTAKTLASVLQAPRREADVAGRGVMDAARLLFCLQLEESSWTAVPFELVESSPWNLGEIVELNRRGTGLAPLCRALAEAASTRVIHIEADAFTVYGAAGTIDRQTCEPEDWWTPEDGSDEQGDARRREQARRLDLALTELGVALPSMRIHSDGYDVQLELVGVAPSAVARLDLVALQELGEPPLDRRPGATPGMPGMVGPGGAPVLAEARPAVVAPVANPTDPPALVPVVGSEPPPMVTKEVTKNEIVNPPAPPEEEPPASVPPAALPAPATAPSAPPPLVSAESVVPNAEPEPE